MENKEKKIKELKKEIEQLRNQQKYGLVWEEYSEKNETSDYTIERYKEKGINLEVKGALSHKIIEGDNLLALRELEKEYNGKIDVIYIDPPYNTGNEFVYSDKLVDKKDDFKHSKWLSFMSKRLELARRLMSDDGVIFVSIDDNEQAQLKLLMDSIFGENNFVGTLHWRKTGQQQNNGKNLATVMEYIHVYAKQLQGVNGIKKVIKGEHIRDRKGIKAYNKEDSKGKFRLNPIRDRSLGKHSYTVTHPTNGKTVTSDNWRITEERYNELEKEGMIYWTDKLPSMKKYLDENKRVLMSNFVEGIYNETSNREIRDLFGDRVFDYAKPTTLIKKLMDVVGDRDAIVLDFFAGSGTTGHAVLELNEEDGGNRQFILCTNNEVSEEKVRNYFYKQGEIEKPNKTEFNKFKKEKPKKIKSFESSNEYHELGIARSVTQPRIKKVIEGYKTPKGVQVKGLSDNKVEYYVISPVKKEEEI